MNRIKSLISFLTIIPAGIYDIEYIARNAFLFPLIGIIIGVIVGSVAYILSFFLGSLIIGLIATAMIFIITGGHHTDALSDFADGLMVKGSRDLKRKVMYDPSAGSAGVASIALYIAGSIIAISLLDNLEVLIAIIASEMLAKFSMTLQTYLGKPAWEGMGSKFTNTPNEKFALSCLITFVPLYILAGPVAIYASVASVIVSLVILAVANRSFGGVSGDVFGATNEISRLASLLTFASIPFNPLFEV